MEQSIYRLGRGLALLVVGISLVVAAVAVFVTFLTAGRGDVASVVAWVTGVVAVLAVLVALKVGVRPPVVVRLDDVGLRGRRQRVPWSEVESVGLAEGVLRLDTGTDGAAAGGVGVQLVQVGERQAELVREVYQRLNTSNGYERFA